MGRYSVPLASEFADFAGIGVASGEVLDVGAGPGALTGELVRRVGSSHVVAVEPSEPFVQAARDRYPDVEIHQAAAEDLPFADGRFDAALAQLVVHFMSDPQAGIGEMRRVTRPGGLLAACVWDHGGGRGPLSRFWQVAAELDPSVVDESDLVGAREGQLGRLFAAAKLDGVEEDLLAVSVEHASFDEWWGPYTLGVGPAGSYVARLDDERREQLRAQCLAAFPADGLTLTVGAWAVRGHVPSG
jgi:SAM-dependent methyltransferase